MILHGVISAGLLLLILLRKLLPLPTSPKLLYFLQPLHKPQYIYFSCIKIYVDIVNVFTLSKMNLTKKTSVEIVDE